MPPKKRLKNVKFSVVGLGNDEDEGKDTLSALVDAMREEAAPVALTSTDPLEDVLLRCSQLGYMKAHPTAVAATMATVEVEVARQAALKQLRDRAGELCTEAGLEALDREVFEGWLFAHRMQVDIAGGTFNHNPLLPHKPDKVADEGLCTALVAKGLTMAKARGIARELAQEAATLAGQIHKTARPAEDVRVLSKKGRDRVVFEVGGRQRLRLNEEHYARLKQLYNSPHGAAGTPKEFIRAVAALLTRYVGLEDTGMQAACPPALFEFLRERFGVEFECFASPLNAYFPRFCSAFPDVDAPFGSVGTFFQFKPDRGVYEANPPFIEHVIRAMLAHMEACLDATEHPLAFVVVVVAWRTGAGWQALNSSPYTRRHVLLSQQEHGYCDGAQHRRENRYKVSTCDSSVFFLQNKAAVAEWSCTDTDAEDLRKAFESKHKEEARASFAEWMKSKGNQGASKTNASVTAAKVVGTSSEENKAGKKRSLEGGKGGGKLKKKAGQSGMAIGQRKLVEDAEHAGRKGKIVARAGDKKNTKVKHNRNQKKHL